MGLFFVVCFALWQFGVFNMTAEMKWITSRTPFAFDSMLEAWTDPNPNGGKGFTLRCRFCRFLLSLYKEYCRKHLQYCCSCKGLENIRQDSDAWSAGVGRLTCLWLLFFQLLGLFSCGETKKSLSAGATSQTQARNAVTFATCQWWANPVREVHAIVSLLYHAHGAIPILNLLSSPFTKTVITLGFSCWLSERPLPTESDVSLLMSCHTSPSVLHTQREIKK